MSQEITFNSTLRAGKHKLAIETRYDSGARKAQALVQEDGRVVDERESILEESISQEFIEEEVRQFHNLIISDLDLLFCIIEKVNAGKNPASLYRLGALFLARGFHEEAIESFQTILEIDSDFESVHYSLGQAWLRQGDLDAALTHLRTAAERRPNYPDLHLTLAELFRKRGEHQQARESCEKALELNPDYLRAHLFLGLIWAESTLLQPAHPELPPPIERLRESRHHLNFALGLVTPEQRFHLEKGLEYLDLRDRLEEGLAEIEKAIGLTTFSHRSIIADSEFYLKFMFADLDRDHRSLENYIRTLEKSIQQHPDYADLHQSLGTAYLLHGWHRFARAVEAYREAVRINPDYQKAQHNLKLLENEGRGFLILLRAILK